jgi:hypothetical protein
MGLAPAPHPETAQADSRLATPAGGERGATPGSPIGYRRAATRRLWYLLGGLALYLGWLWGLRDDIAKMVATPTTH